MSKKPNAKPAKPALSPAMSPFDIETSPEAQRHLAATISQITLDFLAKGLRQVAVPLGQANAVKGAFEGAATGPMPACDDIVYRSSSRRWRVDIAKVNGLLAELHFSAEGDPTASVPASVLLPRIDELLAWTSAEPAPAASWPEIFGDDRPLGKILGNLRALRAMVDG